MYYVKPLKVYQIGLRDFGRYGFEKLVEMHNHLEEVDLELEAVCDRDFEALEEAVKFADVNGIEIQTFMDIEELYTEAEGSEEQVMIYDAGLVNTRPEHIYRSMRNGFFHLAERPPSLKREQHMKERKLSRENDVFWKVDFIERENPAVRKAVEILEGEEIEAIEIFSQNSGGVRKMLQPVELSGLKGGDILERLTGAVYVLDLLEAAGTETSLEVVDAHAEFMPKNPGADSLMTVEGSKTDSLDGDVATARSSAQLEAPGAAVKLHSSWLGVTKDAREIAENVEDITGHSLIREEFTEAGNKAFRDEEARFFVVEGSRRLAGDLVSEKLFDLETGEELEVPDMLHDPLYRVIEKAVLQASEIEEVSREGVKFMETIFDMREIAIENAGEFFDELEHGNSEVGKMIVEEDDEEAAPA